MSRRNFFQWTPSLLNVFKTFFFVLPIRRSQIFNCGSKRPDAPEKNTLDIQNSQGVPPRKSNRSRRSSVLFFILNVFLFSKFLILSTGLLRRRLPPKIAARWRYRLPIENLTAHYNTQFCVSFNFWFCQKARL